MPETLIRLPADAARVVLAHEGFRFLGCAARLRGDWVERRSDRKMFFEVRDPSPEDAREFMAFADRVAGHMIPAA